MEARQALWNIHNITVLERHLHNQWIPDEHQAMAKQVLCRLSFFGAWNDFSQDLFREARALFLRCVRYEPFRVKHWIYFLATMLPPPLIETIRSLKRSLQAPTTPSAQT